MKRICLACVAAALLAGCRSPSSGTLVPYGPQRVPAPGTGSIGTPVPQPTNPYYPGAMSQAAPSVNGSGWRPPGASLNAGGLAQSQPAFSTQTANPAGTNLAPNSGFATAPATPMVTNPAVIRNQALPASSGGATGFSTFGNGGNTPPASPWQPSAPAGATTAPQMYNTGAPLAPANHDPGLIATIRDSLGLQSNTQRNTAPVFAQPGFAPQPGVAYPPGTVQPGTVQPGFSTQPNTSLQPGTIGQPVFGQPPPGAVPAGQPIGQPMGQPAATIPFNPAPYSSPTSAAPVSPPWSLGGARNWAQPASSPLQTQWATGGYSTAAPQPLALPLRGTTVMPTAVAAPATAGVAPVGYTAPTAGAASAWNGTASASAAPTVRGNDSDSDSDSDSDEVASKPETFVASGQSSPVAHSAERFAHHPQFLWLRGQLEFSSTERRWKLRYIPHDAAEGRMDSYGGSVVLTPTERVEGFKSGDFVLVAGKLGQTGVGSDYAPVYDVQQITRID